MTLVIVAGFSLQLAMGRSSFAAPWYVHAHAVVFMAWVGIYLTQNVLARNQLIGFGLGLAAGNFLFLAVGDLLQELDFRGPRRYLLSVMLLAGVGLAVLIGKLETSGHEHHRPAAGAGHDHGHSHDDHDHTGHDHAH